LLDDLHVKHRDVIRELSDPGAGEKIKQIGFPVKFSRSLDDIRRVPPTKGEHSEEILIGLGYSKEDLKRFKSEKII
jgi:crotonobetainyl-CoA:carnitine CoA-transferase CaiB-like acyl-CoA transferase